MTICDKYVWDSNINATLHPKRLLAALSEKYLFFLTIHYLICNLFVYMSHDVGNKYYYW